MSKITIEGEMTFGIILKGREGTTDEGIKERRHSSGGNNDVSKEKSRTRAMCLKGGTWSIEGQM